MSVQTATNATLSQASLEPAGLELWTFLPNWLNEAKAGEWHNLSQSLINWQHNEISMFGKKIPLPRLEAIIGDGDYSYSGVTLKAQPWGEEFLALKEDVEAVSGYGFQIAIGNQYRDGNDHSGWHSDDSPEMGKRPAIASLSLGAIRKFQLRHKVTREIHTFELTHGSLFVMHPGCQEEYQHRLVKAPKNQGLRINWTFRPLTTTAQTEDSRPCKPDSEQVLESHSDRSPTCSTCQNHEMVEAPEGASLKCSLRKMIGVIASDGCIAEVTAQNCDAYSPTEILEAEIIPELRDLESQIESGQRLIGQGEQAVWSAAALIRQHSLWKVDYQSFEDYCLKRWNWQKSNAHEVATAGAVFLQLKESGVPESELPTAIAAYRPLRKLQPEDRRELLQQVMNETGKLTADAIKQAVEQQAKPSKPASSQSQPQSSTAPLTNSTSLPYNLKNLAQQKSDEVYNALCKLNADADSSALAEIAEEVRAAIAQILESHLL